MKHRPVDLVYADQKEQVYDYPDREPLFRTGSQWVRVDRHDLIKLPFGSYLYYLPGRHPVYYDRLTRKNKIMRKTPEGGPAWAVSAFLSSGYLRTYLPASHKTPDAPVLPLWAYSGVVFMDEDFYVPAIRIDEDPRSDPQIHQDYDALLRAIRRKKAKYPKNRLIRQLAKCSTQYDCLCARNFFLERYEAPIPTSPACNAGCIGCLSHQDDRSGFTEPQHRLDFKPTPEEIADVIIHHFKKVKTPVASFGQGCEGEPLLRGEDLVRAIRMVRQETDRGTINLNTNGSNPEMARKLIEAGLDSIRISMNSPTREYYLAYHHPVNYRFEDVLSAIEVSLSAGIFVSINLFFMPGFTDMETEVQALYRFLDTMPVNMIQTRNLNIDPDLYFSAIGYTPSPAMGIPALIRELKKKYQFLRLGYYNPPKETFS